MSLKFVLDKLTSGVLRRLGTQLKNARVKVRIRFQKDVSYCFLILGKINPTQDVSKSIRMVFWNPPRAPKKLWIHTGTAHRTVHENLLVISDFWALTFLRNISQFLGGGKAEQCQRQVGKKCGQNSDCWVSRSGAKQHQSRWKVHGQPINPWIIHNKWIADG